MPNSLHSQLKFFNNFIHNKNFWIILLTDIVLLVLAHYCAYLLRFPGWFYGPTYIQFATALPLLIAIKIPTFYAFGLYPFSPALTFNLDFNLDEVE